MKRNIFIGFVFMCLFVVSCQNSNTNNQGIDNANQSVNTDTSKLAVFYFEEEEHDFGKVTEGEKVSFSFKFKNTGASDLIITDAKGSCGCTVADYPKDPIAPNKEGFINVTFNTEGKKGFQSKSITLRANIKEEVKALKVKAQIYPKEEK
ncbi:MAG TPA: DUF1573 domain-containing protein [Bacteroidales bacterium]|nr:DUF1573 domain-containing protein [Bacteroidales bacterium]HQH18532.1 DUF1573 domain-containing protein [Bacteroidales bacterium]HQI45369.1 DUF1573 domain-containing protein [Bacteroidales bacterium]